MATSAKLPKPPFGAERGVVSASAPTPGQRRVNTQVKPSTTSQPIAKVNTENKVNLKATSQPNAKVNTENKVNLTGKRKNEELVQSVR